MDIKQEDTLLTRVQQEKEHHISNGIYHHIQIELTYNSNHIEGSQLTHEQTRYIFETNTIGVQQNTSINVDDIMETANHFRCIDAVIDNAVNPLTPKFIKTLHRILKTGTSDSRKEWVAVGEYKRLPNEVGGNPTTLPEEVPAAVESLLQSYESKTNVSIRDIIALHVQFEQIHPFQDGNGRVGRLLLFKEWLRHQIVPVIVTDDLLDTCGTGQDRFCKVLEYFRIPYDKSTIIP